MVISIGLLLPLHSLHSSYIIRPTIHLNAINPFHFKLKYPVHVPDITALHNAQFGEYGSASTMVTTAGQNPSPPPRGKEDILKAVGIRVKQG